MSLASELLKLVPMREKNAVSGLLLWRHMGMYSAAGVRHKLNEMAAEGLIERKRGAQEGRETSLYFKARGPKRTFGLV